LEKRTVLIWNLQDLQDLKRLLFSNVVDQAAQKIEYYLAYYMGGGGGIQAIFVPRVFIFFPF
jgi:hypothetical protein